MARTNQDGKDIKLVLEWLCRRRLADADLAAALGMPCTNYNRRRDAEDFPSFEELRRFAESLSLCARALQIAFGLRDRDELVLLDDDGWRQYIEQGGGERPVIPPLRGSCPTTIIERHKAAPTVRRRQRRADAPPGP